MYQQEKKIVEKIKNNVKQKEKESTKSRSIKNMLSNNTMNVMMSKPVKENKWLTTRPKLRDHSLTALDNVKSSNSFVDKIPFTFSAEKPAPLETKYFSLKTREQFKQEDGTPDVVQLSPGSP